MPSKVLDYTCRLNVAQETNTVPLPFKQSDENDDIYALS